MKINKVELDNLGPYVGHYEFNTKTTKKENIIIFGGKNGAGKTSLFTAIRLCLYGYKSMGYLNQCEKYNKEVIKFVNDEIKNNKLWEAGVKIKLDISNGHEIDNYILDREWSYNKTLKEEFIVVKNKEKLNEEEILDFEKYILNVIPPDVFNLYFFDGETIVDYFLSEDGNKNLKSAIMSISGFDIFSIIKENFARNKKINDNQIIDYENYQKTKKSYEEVKNHYDLIVSEIKERESKLKNVEIKIVELNKKYKALGGIDKEEWKNILEDLKNEENKRSENYAIIKKEANDSLPFLLLPKLVAKLEKEINAEETTETYENFLKIFNEIYLNKTEIISDQQYKIIKAYVEKKYNSVKGKKHDLSIKEKREVLYQIEAIKKLKNDYFDKIIEENNESLYRSKILNEKLDKCTNDNINQYIEKKDDYYNYKDILVNEINDLKMQYDRCIVELHDIEKVYCESRNLIELQIKNNSIEDISTKSLVMLDSLEKELYDRQIEKIEKNFSIIVKKLLRKIDFIDKISIDENFKITAYKSGAENSKNIINIINNNSNNKYTALLLKIFKKDNKDELLGYLSRRNSTFEIPIFVDYTKISKGEKQIFIMALYYAIITLTKNRVPFIIDTPFARIDTEHRVNIAKNFFPNLKGQVFILSTNEEINKKFIVYMKKSISKTYLLSNEGGKTNIYEDKYF